MLPVKSFEQNLLSIDIYEKQTQDTSSAHSSSREMSDYDEELPMPLLPKRKERPLYGCLAGIVAQSTGATYAISTKALFDRHDNMHPMQMAAIRSVISGLILLVVLNRDLKYVMWDNVDKGLAKSLSVKVI